MERLKIGFSLGLLLLEIVSVALAQGTPLIHHWIIGGGGGTAVGGDVSLGSTLGQAIAGPSSGGNVAICVGFWSGRPTAVGHTVFYLPLLLRRWPPIPDIPTLNPINLPGDNATYTVSWNAAYLAETYILQEAKISDFSDATVVYTGAALSHVVDCRGIARYYYRVKARNSWGDSGWSNVQSVDVFWEEEPNNDALTQANGPIVSGQTYYGIFPSPADFDKDYFYFDLPASHSVELWLTHIPTGQDYDLALRDANMNEVARSDNGGQSDEHIQTDILPVGRYYVQIYHYNSGGSTQPYHLRVVYQ